MVPTLQGAIAVVTNFKMLPVFGVPRFYLSFLSSLGLHYESTFVSQPQRRAPNYGSEQSCMEGFPGSGRFLAPYSTQGIQEQLTQTLLEC